MQISHFLDKGSLTIASVTMALFIAALFTKGLTHDLFLEAGVLLVSVKIIIMAYRNSVYMQEVNRKLDRVLEVLAAQDKAGSNKPDGNP